MSIPNIASPAIEHECEVFTRRMAVHLAKRKYALAWRIIDLAAKPVGTTWGRLAPLEPAVTAAHRRPGLGVETCVAGKC